MCQGVRKSYDLKTITSNIVDKIGALDFDILHCKCKSRAEQQDGPYWPQELHKSALNLIPGLTERFPTWDIMITIGGSMAFEGFEVRGDRQACLSKEWKARAPDNEHGQ